jgi:hypothetical protein
MIQIKLEGQQVRAGERLRGQALWNSSGSKQPRKIEVTCQWRIEGKGRAKKEVVERTLEPDIRDRTQVTVPFDFAISTLGPLSYEGKLLSIIWEVVARVDLPFAVDEVETKTFRVTPGEWQPDLFPDDEEDLEDEDFLDDQDEETA